MPTHYRPLQLLFLSLQYLCFSPYNQYRQYYYHLIHTKVTGRYSAFQVQYISLPVLYFIEGGRFALSEI